MKRCLIILITLSSVMLSSRLALSADDSFRVLRQQLEGYAKVVPSVDYDRSEERRNLRILDP